MRLIFAFMMAVTFLGSQLVFAGQPLASANIRVSCFTLAGMQERLNHVVDEMQLYNNDVTTWHSKDGCAVVTGRSFTSDKAVAQAHGVFSYRKVGFVGWLVTDKWLLKAERVAYLDKAKEVSWRPAAIYSRKQYVLLPVCYKRTLHRNGVAIVGHQYTLGNIVDVREAVRCLEPMLRDGPAYQQLGREQ